MWNIDAAALWDLATIPVRDFSWGIFLRVPESQYTLVTNEGNSKISGERRDWCAEGSI